MWVSKHFGTRDQHKDGPRLEAYIPILLYRMGEHDVTRGRGCVRAEWRNDTCDGERQLRVCPWTLSWSWLYRSKQGLKKSFAVMVGHVISLAGWLLLQNFCLVSVVTIFVAVSVITRGRYLARSFRDAEVGKPWCYNNNTAVAGDIFHCPGDFLEPDL